MRVCYPETAYFAPGNYGVEYDITLPLYNYFGETHAVEIILSSPVKNNEVDDVYPPDSTPPQVLTVRTVG
jgi:hypothetical protein